MSASTFFAMHSDTTQKPRGLPVKIHRNEEWLWYGLLFLLGFCGAALAYWVLPEREPVIHDEFSQLVTAQAFAEGRLTNPTHPKWEHFEAHHVLHHPTYASKYQPGRIFFMTLGLVFIDNAHFGMWLLQGLLYPAIFWMLRGFLPARWALFGSLVAFATFGHFSHWAQLFWGGTLPALGGALVFGGAWRLVQNPRATASLLTGLGVAALFFSRPFEGLLACLTPAALCVWAFFRHGGLASASAWAKVVLPASSVLLVAFGFQVIYNQAVTGDWRNFPYTTYEAQYSPISSNFFFAQPVEQEYRTPYIERFYMVYVLPRIDPDLQLHIIFGQRLTSAIMTLAGPFFALLAVVGLWKPRRPELLAVLTILFLMTGSFFNISYHSFYYSPVYAPFCLLITRGGRRLWLCLRGSVRLRSSTAGRGNTVRVGAMGWVFLLLFLAACVQRGFASFEETALRYYGDDHNQAEVREMVEPNSVVFVHYLPEVGVAETLTFNSANIDAQSVIFANDLGPRKNSELLEYYSSRERQAYFLIVAKTGMKLLPYDPRLIDATLRRIHQRTESGPDSPD